MLSSLSTKLALKKVGLSSKDLDLSAFAAPSQTSTGKRTGTGDDGQAGGAWGTWMSNTSLPLKVTPWLSPPPPPVKLAPVPRIGQVAPLDRQRRLQLGGRTKCLVVFLRCVGCAFAQKTFLKLRAIANRHAGSITCIAVSHSSERATYKWIDLLGGSWNVQIVIDQERSIYAAWGLGTANSICNSRSKEMAGRYTEPRKGRAVEETAENGSATELGSKWQEAGAFAVDGRGTVVWGGKATSADDVMDLDEGAKLLML
ncbi:hypothetical protein T069G_06471 [Trichoderma breve]|uniref:Alkyl hydroperoxide reductase subunit C/ Thiol specific antioxidant domain-containing protein n=1 Tax=Trichoderma breve TaxID=2034170 RepID=A0A9W9BBC2_9HYPO|nr:hypothetical protein T069G_06471 [Trichoderma breve]KAJ4858204.1 hypothetical protein T069G_06471 [Trichoderma breve]